MTLLELQQRVAAAVMTPLNSKGGIAVETVTGEPMAAEAEELIKPNDRLRALDRLEIYNRQYWYRLCDSLYDDFPGLRSVLGARAFDRTITAYLMDHPSRSFTLRNLGSHMESWLREHPEFAGRNLVLALDMARLEWAHIEAFDRASEPPLGPEDLLELGPDMRFSVQPHVMPIELHYPVDDLRIKIHGASDEHDSASNAVLERRQRSAVQRFRRLPPQEIFLAVHRIEFDVYYRRLEKTEFRLLQVLGAGIPVGEALERALADCSIPEAELGPAIQGWFAGWSRLGWLCRPAALEPGDPA